ncbi:hypothetical protein [Fodinicola acaciae]|uniref:hypothetical protein n=1 Tax=Fodinicola acaciae TaxID=2681555 RepID=UPI0013D1CC9A|nr:hypothetical protein [Fodinicola acaciae]
MSLALRSHALRLAVASVVAGALILAGGTIAGPAAAAGVHSTTAASTCWQSYLPLPDPTCQPGANNPDVTTATIHSTICVSGYSSSIRPPTSYTTPLKIQQISEYGYTDTSTADYEEDHLIALEDGGDPRSPQNLWPEPRYTAGGKTAADKDTVENKIHTAICNDTVNLDAARHAIATNWTTALQVLGIN